MALHLLQHDRDGARASRARADARRRDSVRHCERCNTFTEGRLCALCRSAKRDATLLCVVETPADLLMVEQTHAYSGLYFVLMGRLSPLDGIGPKEIRLERLLARATDGVVREVDPGDQFHQRGRGDRALHRRTAGGARPQGDPARPRRAGRRRARVRRQRNARAGAARATAAISLTPAAIARCPGCG